MFLGRNLLCVLLCSGTLTSVSAKADSSSAETDKNFFLSGSAAFSKVTRPGLNLSVSQSEFFEIGAGYRTSLGSDERHSHSIGFYLGDGHMRFLTKDPELKYQPETQIDLSSIAGIRVGYEHLMLPGFALTTHLGASQMFGDLNITELTRKVTSQLRGQTYSLDLGCRVLRVMNSFDFVADLSSSAMWMTYKNPTKELLYLNSFSIKVGLEYAL